MVFCDLTTVRIHGEGTVGDDLRACGMNREVGGIARQVVLGVVQTAEGSPLRIAKITDAPDLTRTEAVARHKALADIERGFRVPKSDIEIAPVHHRPPDRIRAHAPICFLAPVPCHVIRMRLKAKGHAASPGTALDLLARIRKHTAHGGKRTFNGISRATPGATRPLRRPQPARTRLRPRGRGKATNLDLRTPDTKSIGS